MGDVQARMQALSEEFTSLQKELQEAVESRQRLDAQKTENLGVQKVITSFPCGIRRLAGDHANRAVAQQELAGLEEDEGVYKLIGPVLLKQDRTEAESTVNGRLEFISKETSRVEGQIKTVQDSLEKIKTQIIQIQAGAQAQSSAKQQVQA